MDIPLDELLGGSGSLGDFELTPEQIIKIVEFFEKNTLRFQHKNLSPGVEKMCEDIIAGKQNSTLAEVITVTLHDGREIRILKSEL